MIVQSIVTNLTWIEDSKDTPEINDKIENNEAG
jgi:hypothetical protein